MHTQFISACPCCAWASTEVASWMEYSHQQRLNHKVCKLCTRLIFQTNYSNIRFSCREEVEKCKDRDLLENMLAEMAGEFPALSRVFVAERDLFLAHSLQLAAEGPGAGGGNVGLLHHVVPESLRWVCPLLTSLLSC